MPKCILIIQFGDIPLCTLISGIIAYYELVTDKVMLPSNNLLSVNSIFGSFPAFFDT